MPRIITKLEVQKNNADRANVYVDGEYALGVHQDLIIQFELHKGRPLSTDEQQQLKAADAEMKARGTALQYLAHKQRSEQEVRDRLFRDDHPRTVIEGVVDRMVELGYLDDAQYARDYVRGRFNNRRYGPFRIRQELQSRGVAHRYIEDALAVLTQDEIVGAARDHALKKWKKTSTDESFLKRKKKTERYLRRRGFTFSTIRSVIGDITSDTGCG